MEVKQSLFLVSMIAFLIMAFASKDGVDSKLFASLGIITGALALKNISTKNQIF